MNAEYETLIDEAAAILDDHRGFLTLEGFNDRRRALDAAREHDEGSLEIERLIQYALEGLDNLDAAREHRVERCAVCGGLNPGDITHTRCA